jgi:hypothetical protein
VDVTVVDCSLAAEDTRVSVTSSPEAVPVAMPIFVVAKLEDEDVLLSPATPQTSVNLVQPVANSPAHHEPLEISQ